MPQLFDIRDEIKKLGSKVKEKFFIETPPIPVFDMSAPPEPFVPGGLVSTTLTKTPEAVATGISAFFESQAQRRSKQTTGQQAVTELIEQPAKIAKAVTVDFPRLILGGFSSVGKTILEAAYTSKYSPYKQAAQLLGVDTSKEAIRQALTDTSRIGKPKTERVLDAEKSFKQETLVYKDIETYKSIEDILFKHKPKSWQNIKEDIDGFVRKSPIATPWEKNNLGITLAIAGFVADAWFPGGKGKLTSIALKELIEATTDDLARVTMIRYGLPEELAQAAAHNVAKATTAEGVETAIRGEAATFIARQSETALPAPQPSGFYDPKTNTIKPVEIPSPETSIMPKVGDVVKTNLTNAEYKVIDPPNLYKVRPKDGETLPFTVIVDNIFEDGIKGRQNSEASQRFFSEDKYIFEKQKMGDMIKIERVGTKNQINVRIEEIETINGKQNPLFKPKEISKATANGETRGSEPFSVRETPKTVPETAIVPKTELSTSISKAKASGQSFDEWVKGEINAYHGTAADFEKFSDSFKGSITDAQSAKGAFWFTDDPATAKAYSIYAAETGPINKLMKQHAALEKIAQKSGKNSDWLKVDELTQKIDDLGGYDATYDRRVNAKVKDVSIKGDFLEVDAKGKTPQELGQDGDIDSWLSQQVEKARKLNKTGLKIKNIDDAVGLYNRPSTHYAVFNPDVIKTRSQLRAEWDGVEAVKPKSAEEFIATTPPKFPKKGTAGAVESAAARARAGEDFGPRVQKELDEVKDITTKQLEELGSKIKALGPRDIGKASKELDDIKVQLEIIREVEDTMPGKKLIKFQSKKEGQFEELKNPDAVDSMGKFKYTERQREAIKARNLKVTRAVESAFEDRPELSGKFDDPDVIREEIEKYLTTARERKALEKMATAKRAELALMKKAELLETLALEQRTNARKALEELTDDEIYALNTETFKGYMAGYLEKRELHRQARIALQATINDLELKKWENARKLLKMPNSFEKMTIDQMREFDEFLRQFEKGDVFLGPRTLQTLKNTSLAGIFTRREAVARSLEDINKLRALEGKPPVKLSELTSIQHDEKWNYMGGNALVRQNPLFEVMIHDIYKADLASSMATLEARETVNELFKAARKSRKRGLVERLVPTDDLAYRWLSAGPEDKLLYAKDMTPAELKAAQWIWKDLAKERDDLLRKGTLTRYVKNYITHIRRSFLEAWKEEGTYVAGVVSGEKPGFWRRSGRGARAAFREFLDRYKQDEAVAGILNQRTGEVLPLEKWFQFSMKRTGQLVPSKNVARAYMIYKEVLNRKRAMDVIFPKYQAIIDSVNSLATTARGLEFDAQLKSFYKEFMNTQKGRVTDRAFLKPGGKLDWVVRTGTAFTRLLFLGFNIPVGLTSQAGAQVLVYKGLGEKMYALGVKRFATPKGRAVAKKYEALVGELARQPFLDAAARFGDKVEVGLYGLFSNASRNANSIFLLGSMSKAEWTSGAIDLDRLALIKKGMARQLPTGGMGTKAIYGQTAIGKGYTQFKSWALPIISTTLSDIGKLTTRKVPLNSREGRETLRAVLLTATIVFATYEFMERKKRRKDRNFMEEVAWKAARDSLSIIGALDPTLYTSEPPLMSLVGDISVALKQIGISLATGDRTQDDKIRGVGKLGNTLKPSVVRQFIGEEVSEAEKEFERLKALPKDEANAIMKEYKENDPPLYRRIKKLKEDEELGITEEDIEIRNMGVENGERAEYIFEQTKDMKTPEEKNAYIKELRKKKIITDDVYKQLKKLAQNEVD